MKRIITAVLAVAVAQVMAFAQNTPKPANGDAFIYKVTLEDYLNNGNFDNIFKGNTHDCGAVAATNNILLIPSDCYPRDPGSLGWTIDVLSVEQKTTLFRQSGRYNDLGLDLGYGLVALSMNSARDMIDAKSKSNKNAPNAQTFKGTYIMTFNDGKSKNSMLENRIPAKNKNNPAAIFLTSPKGVPVIIAVRNSADGGYTYISKDMAVTLQAMGAKIVNEKFEEVSMVQPGGGRPYRKGTGEFVQLFKQSQKDNGDAVKNAVNPQIKAMPALVS